MSFCLQFQHNKFLHFPTPLKRTSGKTKLFVQNQQHFKYGPFHSGKIWGCANLLENQKKKSFQPKFCALGGVGGSSFQIFQMGFCRKCVTFGNHYMSVKDCSHASSGKTLAQFLAFAQCQERKKIEQKIAPMKFQTLFPCFNFIFKGKYMKSSV